MASINVAPFIGAIVFNQRAWNSIPERFRPQLIEVTRRLERELDQTIKDFESELIRTMETHGLTMNQLSKDQEQLWYDEIGRITPSLIGTMLDRDVYNRIDAMLRDHRSRQR